VQQQKPRGLRRFLGTPVGKALLIALTVLIVFASYVYVEAIVAIPAFLIFGLAIPIWAGLKRPRFLALFGLVVILLVPPMTTAVITQEVRAPIPIACSSLNESCTGNNNGLLQNASVGPYTGTAGSSFTWTVTVFPRYVPPGNTTLVNLSLYVSTCPGATSTSPPSWCSAGYPFHQITHWFNNLTVNSSTPTTIPVTFQYSIGSSGIWDWQMGVYTRNNTTHSLYYQTLTGDPTYNGLEGPVVGTFATTFGELLPTIYVDDLLFLAGPFYIVLLIYMFYKSRERRRQEAQKRAAGPVPPTGGGTAGGGPTTLSAPPPAMPAGTGPAGDSGERTCPNCNAVVYANETRCWKCGADLSQTAVSTPLPCGKQA